ncbi:MAG: Na+/H+ antiporter subunit E [Balneolaceae bacterium]
MKRISSFNLFLSFVALMSFWLIMSGMFKPVQIAQGVASVIFVIAFNYRLRQYRYFDDERDQLTTVRLHYALYYFFWIVWEFVKAGFHVSLVILTPKSRLHTTIVRFRVDLPCAEARMVLGNSITLTPGTLTVEICDNEFIVHSFTPTSHAGIVDDTMPRKVLKLFVNEERPVVYDVKVMETPGGGGVE